MNYVNCALLVVVLVLVVMCCKNNEEFSQWKRKRDLRRLYKQKAGLRWWQRAPRSMRRKIRNESH